MRTGRIDDVCHNYKRVGPGWILFRLHTVVSELARCGNYATPLALAAGFALIVAACLLSDMMAVLAEAGAGDLPVALVWLAVAATLRLTFVLTWGVYGVLLAGVSR